MKKKILIFLIVLISICFAFMSYYFFLEADTKDNSLIETEVKETQETISSEEKEENISEEENKTVEENIQSTSETNVEQEISSTNTSTSSNNTSSNSNDSKKDTDATTTKEITETAVETSKETETTSESSYVGVPDSHNFFYSIHQGQIDYKTLDECLSVGEKIALSDTVEIINFTCYEVVDSEGTILGYYLEINCASGNCEKYK